ncbi:hypothetical protein EMIT047CA2_110167 [Pseudomonas soli]
MRVVSLLHGQAWTAAVIAGCKLDIIGIGAKAGMGGGGRRGLKIVTGLIPKVRVGRR